MKRLLLAALATATIVTAYPNYYIDYFSTLDTTKWYINGTPINTNGALQFFGASNGSLISKVAVPDGTSDGQAKMTLSLGVSGGVYILYLRANPTATTYYSVEVQNPVINGTACSATLVINKSVNSVVTTLSSSTIPCYVGWGMEIRATIRDSSRIIVRYGVEREVVFWVDDTSSPITSGSMGVGGRSMPNAGGIIPVELFVLDRVAPAAVNPQLVGTSAFPNEVDAQWVGTSDNTGGVGMGVYQVLRNGVPYRYVDTPEFTDASVSPSTTYTYTIVAMDYHTNPAPPATISVTTPAAGALNPRRVGVRPTGSYWGGSGEQIDLLSGNLNFTAPILRAMGRGGWSVPFALSYNSQIWRQDSGGTWLLGRDDGYGLGWRLMAGSLTPYWSDQLTIHHYTFTDSTGAEYRLDTNSNGIWSSTESIYLAYDAFNQVLHFPDGTFWVMNGMSGGAEQDAGTRYPTIMEDTNGNQILIRYNKGVGATSGDTSSRINQIEDVRAVDTGTTGVYTYQFTYNTDPIPHLTTITSTIHTVETHKFTYLTSQSLNSPFSPAVAFGTTTLLKSGDAVGSNVPYKFQYDAGGSGELTQMTNKYGGILRWTYRSFTYAGARTMREVQNRYLTNLGWAEITYPFTRNDAVDANLSIHSGATLDDPSGSGEKAWTFATTGAAWQLGTLTRLEDRPSAAQASQPLRRQDYTWVQDTLGNAYVSTVLTTLDPATANLQTKTTQSLDTYGNVLATTIYAYGNLSTPARSYSSSYLTDTNYTSRYIFNRLVTSILTAGSQNVTLVTNTYDTGYLTNVSGQHEHDGANYGTAFTYRGNVTQSVVPGNITHTSYDITGNPVSRSDGVGYSLALTVNSTTNFAAPSVITPNSNTSLQTTASYAGLAPSSITGPNNATATITYDGLGDPLTSTSVNGAATSYSIGTGGGLPYQIWATTNNHTIQTVLDGFGRPTTVARSYTDGTGSHAVSYSTTYYGPCACSPVGKATLVSLPYTGSTVYSTTYTYDGLGRTATMTAPDGASVTHYSYSGNVTTVSDPAGIWKIYTYDVFGNLTQVTEPDPAGGSPFITTYTYDLLNHLTQVNMSRPTGTQTRTFVYDANQRLASETHPESGTKSYTYNGDGTLATRTDAKGQITKYTYDSFKRVTMVQYFPDPAHPTTEDTSQRLTNTYDTGTNGWGRLATSQWSYIYTGVYPNIVRNFSYSYGYTPGGLITSKTLSVNNATLTGSYTYDNEGRLTSEAYPITYTSNSNGAPVPLPQKVYNYSYDGMGRPVGMTDNLNPVNTYVQGVTYNPADLVTQGTYDGGLETRQYNGMNQLTRLTNAGVDMEYVFPAPNRGKLWYRVEHYTGETIAYDWDYLNRLYAAHATASTMGPAWTQSFTYDGFGNLTDKTPTVGSTPALHVTVNPANNRITTAGYAYDANGNLYSGGLLSLQFDAENRVTSALTGSSMDRYSHGPDNLRVWKLRPDGVDEIYYYDPLGQRLGTYTFFNYQSTNSPLTQASLELYFAGRKIKSWGLQYGQPVPRDRLGSIGPAFYPYGEEYATTAQNLDKFATYFRDGTTALDYARNRYYSSNLGRFMSADPSTSNALTDPGQWNKYGYVGNDPVNFNDPSGLFAASVNCWKDCNLFSLPNDYLSFSLFMGLYASGGGGSGGGGDDGKNPTGTAQVAERLIDIRKTIDPDCLGWLESGIVKKHLDVFNRYFNGLLGVGLSGPLAGVANLGTSGPNAETGNFGTGYTITVNTMGAFFQRSVPLGFADRHASDLKALTGGTDAAQRFVLLHELAHFFQAQGFGDDFDLNHPNDVSLQEKNNDLLWDKCSKTIKGPIQ